MNQFICMCVGGVKYLHKRSTVDHMGYSDLVWTGVPLKCQNPYPFLTVILAEKSTHLGDFFFLQNIGPFFTIFRWSHGKCLEILENHTHDQ